MAGMVLGRSGKSARGRSSVSDNVWKGSDERLARLEGRLGASEGSIHAHVIGEHGDSAVVVWSAARVGGEALRHWPGWAREKEPAPAGVVGRQGVTEVIEPEMSPDEKADLERSVDILRQPLDNSSRDASDKVGSTFISSIGNGQETWPRSDSALFPPSDGGRGWTSTLSTRFPSMSTTSKRKPMASKRSAVTGMRPICIMTNPPTVR